MTDASQDRNRFEEEADFAFAQRYERFREGSLAPSAEQAFLEELAQDPEAAAAYLQADATDGALAELAADDRGGPISAAPEASAWPATQALPVPGSWLRVAAVAVVALSLGGGLGFAVRASLGESPAKLPADSLTVADAAGEGLPQDPLRAPLPLRTGEPHDFVGPGAWTIDGIGVTLANNSALSLHRATPQPDAGPAGEAPSPLAAEEVLTLRVERGHLELSSRKSRRFLLRDGPAELPLRVAGTVSLQLVARPFAPFEEGAWLLTLKTGEAYLGEEEAPLPPGEAWLVQGSRGELLGAWRDQVQRTGASADYGLGMAPDQGARRALEKELARTRRDWARVQSPEERRRASWEAWMASVQELRGRGADAESRTTLRLRRQDLVAAWSGAAEDDLVERLQKGPLASESRRTWRIAGLRVLVQLRGEASGRALWEALTSAGATPLERRLAAEALVLHAAGVARRPEAFRQQLARRPDADLAGVLAVGLLCHGEAAGEAWLSENAEVWRTEAQGHARLLQLATAKRGALVPAVVRWLEEQATDPFCPPEPLERLLLDLARKRKPGAQALFTSLGELSVHASLRDLAAALSRS